ncbi:hypothetical protein VC885_25895, partial [Citrobacter freundii]|uniref:hypothetical protein n=1 Tax=Citrobacter freundii TaxID=546 RepID=UPI00293424EE
WKPPAHSPEENMVRQKCSGIRRSYLGIKAVFLVLTLMGMGTMWMAVFADVGASLLVVANGLRLLRK